jgi:thioredoxin 1
MIERTDTASFDRDVLSSSVPVLVDFTADWCGPCRMMTPVLQQIAEERSGTLRVVQVDTDADPELSIRFNVLGMPTLALFDNGELVSSVTGARPKSAVLRQVDGAA